MVPATLSDEIARLTAELEAVKAERDALAESLQFYADPKSWARQLTMPNFETPVEIDAGRRAHFALARLAP
jgi:hypothetical protein